ncbi:YfhO family protein [Lacticaseibacillus thailandensis]|uniref:YfhO family protein n=1 Tax=Lacticaseibacillus thailandensis TaxID=381741 RepID=UPI00138F7A46|nr:YfhO family protein [Lacticaseibacillus thailandensis]
MSSTIPYSTGWHLKGSDKILPRVNYGFIGIPNKEGKIILYYDTPGLRTGMLVTLLGLVAFAIEAFGYKGRQKKKNSRCLLVNVKLGGIELQIPTMLTLENLYSAADFYLGGLVFVGYEHLTI